MEGSSTGRERVRLGDVLKITHGWPFKSEFFSEERKGRPIIVSIGNFQYTGGFRFESTTVKEYSDDYPKEYELSPRDILLVMTCQTSGGEILGIPGRIPGDGSTYLHNQRLGKVVIKEPKRIDPDFVYYLALWPDFNRELCVSASGTKILHTAPVRIEAFELDLPPLAEQKAIAAVLGSLDDKIELNRRMNATLEAMARVLFQSWFVDFDPVRTKLDGGVLAGRDPDAATAFPATFQDSEVGNIPKGWTVVPVGDVVDCVGGGTPSTAEAKYWEGGTHHWATPKDFSSLQAPVLLATGRKLTDAGMEKVSSGLLPVGTVLMSSRAPVGYLAIAAIPVAINQGFIALKGNDRASNFFMLNWCQANMVDIKSRATGTTFAEISKRNFRPILLVLPPRDLMRAFTAKVAPLYERITNNLRESRTLATLRDTLLPKLLSGAVRVTSVESGLAAAG